MYSPAPIDKSSWVSASPRSLPASLRLLETYGILIGNTDRHYGNISLLLNNDNWML